MATSTQPASPTGPLAGQALFHSLIDYAGLFPPAKLSMSASVRAYAEALNGGRSWMLGRFIVPVSRLEEFRVATEGLLPRCAAPVPAGGALECGGWPLSGLIDGDLDEQLDAIYAFNHEHQQVGAGLAEIDAIEMKVGSAAELDAALDAIPDAIYPFFEIDAAQPTARGLITALAGCEAAAKIRTGGVVETAIPPIGAVAAFLADCRSAEVPLKATAGLHHAIRGSYALTYEPGSARATMHGFLNVFCAALFAAEGATSAYLEAVLGEGDAKQFVLTDAGLTYRGRGIETARIVRAREEFGRSFGSCSFSEPVDDLSGLGLI